MDFLLLLVIKVIAAVILGVPQGVAYEIGRFRPLLLILYDKICSKSNFNQTKKRGVPLPLNQMHPLLGNVNVFFPICT